MSASARQDNRYFASAGLTYKLNRELQLKGTVRQDWLTSNVTGVAYDATSFLVRRDACSGNKAPSVPGTLTADHPPLSSPRIFLISARKPGAMSLRSSA